VSAVIFDFDGLILDTETPEYDEWKAIFEASGHAMDDEWWFQLLGSGPLGGIEQPAARWTRLTGQPADEIHAKARTNIVRRINQAGAMPGIESLIRSLHHDRRPIAIASSSKHDWVDGYLDLLGLRQFFPVVCCADDVRQAKPWPDLYLLACSHLGIEPSKAIALEDSVNGITAAKRAGLRVFAIPNPLTARLDLTLADSVFESASAMELRKALNLL
jgi:HAD superfamily hydrolase (TIGR01509 family)